MDGHLRWRKNIRLLEFPETLREAFGTLGKYEAEDVLVYAKCLAGEEGDVHAEQFGMVEFELEGRYAMGISDHSYCQNVLEELPRRLLSDEERRGTPEVVYRAYKMDY